MSRSRVPGYRKDLIVYQTFACPRTDSAWMSASLRMNCNVGGKNPYYCIPNAERTHFVEFCYDRASKNTEKGNCWELGGLGYLNQVNCTHFIKGCPDYMYLSERVYRIPACLDLNFSERCFTEEPRCTALKKSIETQTDDHKSKTSSDILATLISTCLIAAILLFVVFCVHRLRTVLRRDGPKSTASLSNTQDGPKSTASFSNTQDGPKLTASLSATQDGPKSTASFSNTQDDSKSPAPLSTTQDDSKSPAPLSTTQDDSKSPAPLSTTQDDSKSPAPLSTTQDDSKSPAPLSTTQDGPKSPAPLSTTQDDPKSPAPLSTTQDDPESPAPLSTTQDDPNSDMQKPFLSTQDDPNSDMQKPLLSTQDDPNSDMQKLLLSSQDDPNSDMQKPLLSTQEEMQVYTYSM